MKKFFSLFICIMALLFAGCELNEPATSNKVETGSATDITTESVVLHGVVNVDISQYKDVELGMMVSEDKADVNARNGKMYKAKVLVGKDFELTLSELSPETEYYYCAWVSLNNTQYEFGDIKKFTTLKEKVGKAFSVSSTKQVYFSKGNLQYTQSTNTWSFAENQWDYLGKANTAIDADVLADKVDLFGWSTGANKFGVSTSTSYSDYHGSFFDWGILKIGNDAHNTWRTLTLDEWNYLLNTRNNARVLKGVAQVNGVNGLILLPDKWTCPSGITFKSGFHRNNDVNYYAAYQTFTAEQWSKLESAGAVFLPAAGCRSGSAVSSVQYSGCYWSATEDDSDYAYLLGFVSSKAGIAGTNRFSGQSVRLVKDL